MIKLVIDINKATRTASSDEEVQSFPELPMAVGVLCCLEAGLK